MITALLTALILASTPADAKDEPAYSHKRDVVYGRKFGTALTMDIFEPRTEANGATVLWVVSGGWYSSHDAINLDNPICPVKPLLARGYRVCAVVHGSNPLFTIEDAIDDIQRAVRYVRHTGGKNGQTTMPLGIIGGSAGGHLSLMAGTAGDDGDAKAKDPVAQASSRVQAVACYFPPTDFLNYGAPGINARETTVGKMFVAPFQFKRLDKETKSFDVVTSKGLIRDILSEVSPITHVSADDAPALIIHGDNDLLVPYQQAELFVDKMQKAGVAAELIRRPGAGHGWSTLARDNELLVDWLDKHLLHQADN